MQCRGTCGYVRTCVHGVGGVGEGGVGWVREGGWGGWGKGGGVGGGRGVGWVCSMMKGIISVLGSTCGPLMSSNPFLLDSRADSP